jgi:hypothetical protein
VHLERRFDVNQIQQMAAALRERIESAGRA